MGLPAGGPASASIKQVSIWWAKSPGIPRSRGMSRILPAQVADNARRIILWHAVCSTAHVTPNAAWLLHKLARVGPSSGARIFPLCVNEERVRSLCGAAGGETLRHLLFKRLDLSAVKVCGYGVAV